MAVFRRAFVCTILIEVFVVINCSTVYVERVDGNDVIFSLYTRNNPDKSDKIVLNDENSLLSSNFGLNKPVKFFFHGLLSKPGSRDYTANIENELTSAFLNVSDCNVFIVDWSKVALKPESEAVPLVPDVGRFAASFIDWLTNFGVAHNSIHVIGLSLGSHVGGFVGRSVKQGRIPYITACDPPWRYWVNSTDKINSGDATYVEVIHTDTEYHAMAIPTGHTDFYPNEGKFMPGCGDNHLCSHMRSIEYYIDSIDHHGFMANKCVNYEEMANGTCSNLDSLHLGGINPKYNKTGIYHLETYADKPFYKG